MADTLRKRLFDGRVLLKNRLYNFHVMRQSNELSILFITDFVYHLNMKITKNRLDILFIDTKLPPINRIYCFSFLPFRINLCYKRILC